jgi:hypothetical protein
MNGIEITGTYTGNNTVQYDYIGVVAWDGLSKAANGENGIFVDQGAYNSNINGNIISGNTENGVRISNGSHDNNLTGNFIGLDSLGKDTTVANGQNGVLVDSGATNNTIGLAGNLTGANFLSGNILNGVWITGSGTQGNNVDSDYIGLDGTTWGQAPNTRGVKIDDYASGNNVNGSYVCYNNGDGVWIDWAASNGVNNSFIGACMFMGHLKTAVASSANAPTNLLCPPGRPDRRPSPRRKIFFAKSSGRVPMPDPVPTWTGSPQSSAQHIARASNPAPRHAPERRRRAGWLWLARTSARSARASCSS